MLDGIFIVFLLFSAMSGAHTGLIRSFTGLIRLYIAAMGAFFMANLLYPIVGLVFLFDNIQKKIAVFAQNLSINAFTAAADGVHAISEELASAAQALSEMAHQAGFPQIVADSFAQKLLDTQPKLGETLLDTASRVVSDNIAYVVVFLLSFVIILIIISFLTGWLIGIIRFIVPRFIDRFFGFFFGIAVGCLWVILFFQFALNAVPALFQSIPYLSPDIVNNTVLVSYLAKADILSFLPGMLKTSFFGK